MIIDANTVPKHTALESDVCIVGAGTAGMTLAREFTGEGFRVCLLESGGLEPDKDTQALAWGEIVGNPDHSLDTARPRYFGGSTNRWHIAAADRCDRARMRPLDAIDFQRRDWVPYSGWPIDKAHMDPFYERAQAVCRIEPPSYELEDWERPQTAPHLQFAGDRVRTVIFKFGSRDPFIKEYAEQVTRAENITTCLNANAVEIETDGKASQVTALRVATLQGNSFRVSSRLFILAAGGMEIPRLLLASNRVQREGLGNRHDLVGRFFMQHLHFWPSGIFVPSSQDIFKSTALYNGIHVVNGVPIIGKLGLSEEVQRSEGLLNYAAQLSPAIVLRASLYQYPGVHSRGVRSLRTLRSALRNGKLPEDLNGHLRNVLTDVSDVTGAVYRHFKSQAFGVVDKKRVRIFQLQNMSEQSPNPESRVTLAKERDRLGLPRVRLDWRISPSDIRSVIKAQEILDGEFRRAGLGRLYIQLNEDVSPHLIGGGFHHMGTTRMSADPAKGVVDADCKMHGISNLFVAGPSVFPTGGYANPSLTIVALSVRLADHIKRLLGEGGPRLEGHSAAAARPA